MISPEEVHCIAREPLADPSGTIPSEGKVEVVVGGARYNCCFSISLSGCLHYFVFSSSVRDLFRYVGPYVECVKPGFGPSFGGSRVLIQGKFLGSDLKVPVVTLNDKPVSILVPSPCERSFFNADPHLISCADISVTMLRSCLHPKYLATLLLAKERLVLSFLWTVLPT